jgi:hypothetical protein
MSSITEIIRTNNQLNVTTDVEKLALGDNEFIEGSFTAASSTTLEEGTVFGRIHATGLFKICDKDSTDGSQYPVGVFYNGIGGGKTIVSGTSYDITLINKGKVNADLLVFTSGETSASVVSDRQFKDHLAAIGLILESPAELSAVDN